MGIPHHRNIGDNAISIAEIEILKKYFGEYELYEIPEANLKKCAIRAKKYIKDDDVILLHGGGNIGDTYALPEDGRRQVIKSYPKNKIIIFPQTAYFSDTSEGNAQLELSKKIYNEHKDLVIMAREKKLYEFMKKNFYNAKVYLTPDIVMTLNKMEDKKRECALLLFRTDKEKVLSDENIEKIKKVLSKKFENVILSDMSYGNVRLINVGGKFRDQILNEKFDQLQKSKLVITDRLHGMIFAAITGTPCIAIKNFNHKIFMSYEWLKNLEYIKLCENIDEIETIIDNLNKNKSFRYDNKFALDIIVPILKKEIKEV